MEGVPAKDQAEWKAKKEAEWGVNSSAHQQANAPKRPRIYHGVIGEDELRVALETHRVLMSGGRLPGHQPGVAGIPPPGMAGTPPPFPPAMPPFPMAGGFPPHPPPPGQLPFPPNLPPPGFRPPFMPPPGGQAMPPMPPFAPPFAMPPPAQSPSVTESATIEVLPPKDGVVWPDPENMPVGVSLFWVFASDHRPIFFFSPLTTLIRWFHRPRSEVCSKGIDMLLQLQRAGRLERHFSNTRLGKASVVLRT